MVSPGDTSDYFILVRDIQYVVRSRDGGRIPELATQMTTDTDTETPPFERELEALILAAFARGAPIEGRWEIIVPVSAAPNWTVTIEKRNGEADPTYEPTFLDE